MWQHCVYVILLSIRIKYGKFAVEICARNRCNVTPGLSNWPRPPPLECLDASVWLPRPRSQATAVERLKFNTTIYSIYEQHNFETLDKNGTRMERKERRKEKRGRGVGEEGKQLPSAERGSTRAELSCCHGHCRAFSANLAAL